MEGRNEFLKKLEYSLALEHPYFERIDPEKFRKRGREAAVLLLFGFHREGGEAHLLITRRSERVVSHRGQMAFPGGMAEEGETSRETALRETREEVGLEESLIEVIGELPPLFTLSSEFWITPWVGLLRAPLEEVSLTLSPQEIEEAAWAPLSELRQPTIYRRESFQVGAVRFPTHVYDWRGNRIWGATAAMIRNLLERLEKE